MSAARDYTPLPPILGDADWSLVFAFFGEDTSTTADFVDGTTFSLVLAPSGEEQPAAGDVHELTLEAGLNRPAANQVGVSHRLADHADWTPGPLDVELRAFGPDGSTEGLYLGSTVYARGLSQLVELGGGDFGSIGPGSSVNVFRDADLVRIVRGEAAGALAQAQAAVVAAAGSATAAAEDAQATAADRVQTGLDRAATAADRVQAGLDHQATDADATATAADRVRTGQDRTATAADRVQTGLDRQATDADATATAADRVQTGLDRTQTGLDRVQTGTDAATTAGNVITSTAQAGIATGKAGEAAASATSAATAAAGAAVNDTAGAALILERVWINDPAATPAQAAANVNRGVENRPAASSGSAYFRRGLLASSTLTAVASFTRATTATGTDNSGAVFSVTTGSPRVSTAGYLSEVASTNLCLQSRARNASPWTLTSLTVTADATAGLDGVVAADKLIPANGVGLGSCSAKQGFAVAAATTYTWSGDYKAAGFGQAEIFITDAAGPASGFIDFKFDLATGAQVSLTGGTWTGRTAKATLQSNGFFRVELTFTTVGATTVNVGEFCADAVATTGNGASGIYADNGQLETLGFATSRMPTTTATFTRNADVAQETVNIPAGQAFTVTGKFTAPAANVAAGAVFSLAPTAGTADRLTLFGTSPAYLETRSGASSLIASAAPALTAGAPCGFAVSVSGNLVTYAINSNGATVQGTITLAGGAWTQAMTRLFLGCNATGSNQLNGTVRELNVLMRALSAAECATFADVSLERSYDFTTQSYSYIGEPYAAITDLPLTTFSRQSAANVKTVGGNYLAVGVGQPRVSDAGLTIEPAITNYFLNSTAPVTQTLTIPTFGAYTLSVVGSGSATISAGTATFTGAGAATAGSPVTINVTGTGTATITIAGGPSRVQFESLTYASTPQDTAGATSTRNADVLVTNEANPPAFSVQAEFTIPAQTPGSARVWQWDDGTNNNRVFLFYDLASGHMKLQAVTGGATQFTFDLGAVAAGSTYKVAAAFAANDVAVSMNGAACLTSAAFAVPSLTAFRFGSDIASSQCWGPGLRRLKRWRGRRVNATLQADAA